MGKMVIAWKCRYCGKLYRFEKLCTRHEVTCIKGPDPHNCYLCENAVAVGYQKFTDNPAYTCKITNQHCTRALAGGCNNFIRRRDDNV